MTNATPLWGTAKYLTGTITEATPSTGVALSDSIRLKIWRFSEGQFCENANLFIFQTPLLLHTIPF